MKFKNWLLQNENSGVRMARPTQTFAANRSQLWGPSATFGQPDSMTPIQKATGAVVTGIGKTIAKRLDRDIQAQPTILPPPPKVDELVRERVLPLQLPDEQARISRNPKQAFYQVSNIVHNKETMINMPNQNDSNGKFPILSADSNPDQINQSINFTTGLILYLLYNDLQKMSNFYDLEDPEVVLQNRKTFNDGKTYLRVVAKYKRRQIPHQIDKALAGQGHEQDDTDDLADRLNQLGVRSTGPTT